MSDDANPYQSPQELPPLVPQGIRFPARPFESGHRRAKWTIGLLILGLPLCVARIAFDFAFLPAPSGGPFLVISYAMGVAAKTPFRAVVTAISVAVSLAIPIAFLMWIHRAYRNLPALGAKRLEYTPASAVGCFFVPALSMIRPYYVAAEVWQKSNPSELPSSEGTAQRRRFSPLIAAWWAAFFLLSAWPIPFMPYYGVLVASVQDFLLPSIPAYSHLPLAALSIASCTLYLVAAPLAVAVVRRIDKGQQAKYNLLLNEPTVI